MRRSLLALTLFFIVCSPIQLAAQAVSNFVPVMPCRVADTRWPTGALGGPSLAGGSTRTFPIPSSSCNIPGNATAYSVNVTVVPAAYLGYITIWPAGQPQPGVSNLNDPLGAILANVAIVEAGTNGAINVYATHLTDVVIDINGYFVAQTSSTSTALGTGASNAGIQNTAVGYNTLQLNSGTSNTAVGSYSLSANASGNNNTALGASALFSNALGSANTALGTNSLLNNLVGNDNTAVGFAALDSNATGSSNVAIGATSLWNAVSGGENVAVGVGSLYGATLGSWNIGIGYQAGNAITAGNYNIDIGNNGVSTDSGVIRIGASGSQSSAYVAGIVNSTVSGIEVVVNSNGQLGVQTSSARFKEAIQDMGNASDALMQLRPITFRYHTPDPDGSKPLHYGLLAEEVEKIYPDLVFRDANERPFALAYQELPALLLNEIQKQRRTIEQQQSKIAAQERELDGLSQRLAVLEKLVAAKAK